MASLPPIRSEVLPIRNHLPRTGVPVTTSLINLRTPPFKPIHPARKHEPKEHNHQPKRKARVQRSAQRHCVLCPPCRGSAAYHIIEDVAYKCPDGEVETSGRRDPRKRAEEDREVDFADNVAFAIACVEPENYWCDGPDREAVYENVISGIGAEELTRSDDTPKDTAIEVDSSKGACEAIDSLWCADSGYIGEHPVQYTNLGNGGHYGGDHLN